MTDPLEALGLGALIAVVVGLVRGLYPGELGTRTTIAVVLATTAALMALAGVSGMLPALTPYQLVAAWFQQVWLAIGAREVAVALAPRLAALPTNTGG